MFNIFLTLLNQPFYFHENSAVRMAGLKAIEQLLQTKELKLKKSADTCWLCLSNIKVLPAVISSLESEAEERGQGLAHGLCKVVKQFKFVAILYMMCRQSSLILVKYSNIQTLTCQYCRSWNQLPSRS